MLRYSHCAYKYRFTYYRQLKNSPLRCTEILSEQGSLEAHNQYRQLLQLALYKNTASAEDFYSKYRLKKPPCLKQNINKSNVANFHSAFNTKHKPFYCRTASKKPEMWGKYFAAYIHCESKKLCHFYFYCNFGKFWSIFKILSMSESERNGS